MCGDGILGTHGVPGGGTQSSSGFGLLARAGTVLCCTDCCGLSRLDGCSGVALDHEQRVLHTLFLVRTFSDGAPEAAFPAFRLEYLSCGVTRHTQA